MCEFQEKGLGQLWEANQPMTHALNVVWPKSSDGPGLCTVCLADGGRRTLKLETLLGVDPDHDSLYSGDWGRYNLARFKLEGEYCVATLTDLAGYWGRVIVWDFVRDRITHLTGAPFALCSTVFHGQVVSMYQANYWYEVVDIDFPASGPPDELDIPNGALWYSTVPLGVIHPEYEPDLCLLPLHVPDDAEDDPYCFDIRTEGDMLVFRAGVSEYRLGSL